jgi:hypothetical protein
MQQAAVNALIAFMAAISQAQAAGIEPRIRDGIRRHAPRTAAEAYELPTVEDMAIHKFPRWEVS